MKERMNVNVVTGMETCCNRLFERLRHLRDQPTNRHTDMITNKLCKGVNKKFKNKMNLDVYLNEDKVINYN